MSKTYIILIIIIVIILVATGIYYATKSGQSTQGKFKKQKSSESQTSLNSFDIQGMKVEIIKEGSGKEAKVGDNIVVNYVGTLEDGSKFDSSIDRQQPFPYTLGQNRVIQGWELGLLGMKVGEQRRLTIPPELGYGFQGRPPVIPENATLIFDIDMLSIN